MIINLSPIRNQLVKTKMTVLKIQSRHRVKPAEPTWRGTLPLSILDQISVITHSSVLYFYNKPTQEEWVSVSPSKNKVMKTLIESLSRALVPFYPLAGRVSYIGNGRFELECNAMGADLIEVESSMKITDFGDFYFDATNKYRELLVPVQYNVTPIEEIPVLAVQITRFACGGLSLGMSMSHVVADGRSAFRFFEAWARMALGDPIKELPLFDRLRLVLGDDLHPQPEPRHHQRVVEKNNVNYFRELCLSEGKNNWGKLVAPTFVLITNCMVERLKEVANEHRRHQQQRPYSRFEVVAAHVWRCVCKARELNPVEMTTMMVAVGVHERMEPPLPSSFFGNGVIEVEASSCVGELLSKQLSYGCSVIRAAIERVNNEYIIEGIKFLQRQTSLSNYQYIDDRGIMKGPAYGDHNVTVVSWLNLTNHDGGTGLDFGWGKEVHMGPPIVQTCDGDIHISSYGNTGSVVVAACLQPKDNFHNFMTSSPLSV